MVISDATRRLTNSETPLLDARVLLSYATGERPEALRRPLTGEEERRFESYIARRAVGEPVAYIVGEKEFMGYTFRLNNHCLIPRPDTETVVEHIIESNKIPSPAILDLCCGSGCIGLSLALFINGARVTLCDVDAGAIDMTRENAALHGLADRTDIFRLDVLTESLPEGFDIIVCNPPYIPSELTDTLEVAKTEPRLALDGGGDGLDFYRVITPKAYASLAPGGTLVYEIGWDQGEAVPALLKAAGFVNITVKKDYGGNDRVVRGEKPC